MNCIKKVQIQPEDALESILYVSKEGEPPGPAQAAFNNLRPGRAYNISVETVSEDQISPPTTAQYRTIPLRPGNLTFDPSLITTTSFQAAWLPPSGYRYLKKVKCHQESCQEASRQVFKISFLNLVSLIVIKSKTKDWLTKHQSLC